jgi:hypothetical protein
MCFSALASFTAAGVLITLGVISIALIPLGSKPGMKTIQKLALATIAAIPLIFGLHQLSEGLVWLDNENEIAINCFAYTAYTFWPAYLSLSAMLTEFTRPPKLEEGRFSSWPRSIPFKARRWWLVLNAVLASTFLVVSAYKMSQEETHSVKADNGRLEYTGWSYKTSAHMYGAFATYTYTVIGSMMVSSLPYSSMFGFAILAALIFTLVLWIDQFPSTWCFFAASLSMFVLLVVWKELQMYQEEDETDESSTCNAHIKPKLGDAESSFDGTIDLDHPAGETWSSPEKVSPV